MTDSVASTCVTSCNLLADVIIPYSLDPFTYHKPNKGNNGMKTRHAERQPQSLYMTCRVNRNRVSLASFKSALWQSVL